MILDRPYHVPAERPAPLARDPGYVRARKASRRRRRALRALGWAIALVGSPIILCAAVVLGMGLIVGALLDGVSSLGETWARRPYSRYLERRFP